jgi:drug/metabolite transporter (DMT)-like permease
VLIAVTPLFSILIAVTFLGERPSWPLFAGAVLIVIGIMNIAVARSGIRISPLAALLGLSPAIFYSLSPVFIRLGMVAMPDRIFGNSVSALGAVLFMLAMPALVPEENRWSLNRGKFHLLLVAGVVYALAFFAYFAAVEISSVSFATPLVYTMSLFSTLISRMLFQEMERITWRVALSAVVMVLGVALISISRGG